MAGGADVLRGTLPSGVEGCRRNMEVTRVHFENVVGVRRDSGCGRETDGGNEGAIVGLSESLERVLRWFRWDRCAGRGKNGLHSRMKSRVTGHMLIAGVLGW